MQKVPIKSLAAAAIFTTITSNAFSDYRVSHANGLSLSAKEIVSTVPFINKDVKKLLEKSYANWTDIERSSFERDVRNFQYAVLKFTQSYDEYRLTNEVCKEYVNKISSLKSIISLYHELTFKSASWDQKHLDTFKDKIWDKVSSKPLLDSEISHIARFNIMNDKERKYECNIEINNKVKYWLDKSQNLQDSMDKRKARAEVKPIPKAKRDF